MNTTWLILAAGFVLLASRRFRPDFVALATVLTLQLTGALTLDQALAGFSNPVVITIAAFMILSYAARNLDWQRRWEGWLNRRRGTTGWLNFWSMWGAGLLSGFMQEEQAVGALLPGTVRVGRRHGVPPSKLLLSLAYGALMGRSLWLVGSPAALLVAWYMGTQGVRSFQVYDLALVSLIALLAGALFMGLVGHTVLPSRRSEVDPLDRFKVRERLMEFIVRADSPVIGRALGEVEWSRDMDVIVLGVIRTHDPILAPPAQLQLAYGDVLIVQADPERVGRLSREAGLEPVPRAKLSPADITYGDIELVEVAVRLDSSLQGQTLRQADFRRRYGLSVLAIERGPQVLVDGIADTALQGGDVLLLQGDRRRVDLMLPEAKAIPLGERALPSVTRERSGWALGGVLVGLGLAASGWLPIPIAFLLIALLMAVLTRYPMRVAYRSMDWPLLVLLAAVVPWSLAMTASDVSDGLVDLLLLIWEQPQPHLVLHTLYWAAVGLVTVLNAPVVAVLLSPVALGAAAQLGVNPEPFLATVALASSFVFLWPVGHRTHVLVQGAGGYSLDDYAKVGLWLAILLGLVLTLTVPVLWPF